MERIKNKDFLMDKDIKMFAEKEIKSLKDDYDINLELIDTNERIIGTNTFHICKVIWKNSDDEKIFSEETLEKGLNPYLYGVRATMKYLNYEGGEN